MRLFFAEQTIRLWQESKQKDERDSLCEDEEISNGRLQNEARTTELHVHG